MSNNKIQYQTKVFAIKLISDRIVENSVFNRATLDVDDVKEAKQKNIELTKGLPYAYLATQGEFSHVTTKAKELLASKELAENTVAKALLIQSLSDRILANFYLKINKPFVKTKIFTDRDKAIDWLKKEIQLFDQSNQTK